MARQIKRYDMYANHDNDVDEVEQDDGEWVRYEDVAPYIKEVENTAPNKQSKPCHHLFRRYFSKKVICLKCNTVYKFDE